MEKQREMEDVNITTAGDNFAEAAKEKVLREEQDQTADVEMFANAFGKSNTVLKDLLNCLDWQELPASLLEQGVLFKLFRAA